MLLLLLIPCVVDSVACRVLRDREASEACPDEHHERGYMGKGWRKRSGLAMIDERIYYGIRGCRLANANFITSFSAPVGNTDDSVGYKSRFGNWGEACPWMVGGLFLPRSRQP